MAAPVAIGGMAAQVARSIIGAMGSAYQGQAQANMYTYQAGVAQLNTTIEKQNADYARASGEVEAQQSGMKTRFQVGSERAAQGGSGLDVNTGSPLAVRESTQEVGAEDTAIVRSNAARRAYGYEVEAAQSTAQAGLDLMSATTAKTAGNIGAVSSLLGGAGSVASKWMGYKSTFG